jgi:hypothetical protein
MDARAILRAVQHEADQGRRCVGRQVELLDIQRVDCKDVAMRRIAAGGQAPP